MLPVVTLVHFEESDHGTLGRLYINGQPYCFAMELPDRGNKVDISRIPVGHYRCVWHFSPRFGSCYRVTGVDGRSYILFHWGNFGGDRNKGLRTDTQGCVLLGSAVGWLGKQRAVLNSRTTVRRFFTLMKQRQFDLVVLNGNASFCA